jgi:hypothetical protein
LVAFGKYAPLADFPLTAAAASLLRRSLQTKRLDSLICRAFIEEDYRSLAVLVLLAALVLAALFRLPWPPCWFC